MSVIYRRILLKLSGESLAGPAGVGIDDATLKKTAEAIRRAHEHGVCLGVVVGGGNFWRGRSSEGMDRVTADHMGMLATTMNALALSDALEQVGVTTRVMSAIEMRQIAETYIRKRAMRHLEKDRVVIYAAGTGNPYFSTDTAAALRAAETQAEVLFKATNVDGVFDKDPKRHEDAVFYDSISHEDILMKNLQVMDGTAATLCRENELDIVVFNMTDPENFLEVLEGRGKATYIR